jgi:hypothetical protein
MAALGERGVTMLDEKVGEKDPSALLVLGELQWPMAGVALSGCSCCSAAGASPCAHDAVADASLLCTRPSSSSSLCTLHCSCRPR